MNEKIVACFTNPIKSRLLLEIQAVGKTTANKLAEIHKDISRATLYRYLKKMTIDGILKVVAENQIRGTLEKVYTVTDDLTVDIQKMLEENNGQAYMMLFTQFMAGLAKEFRAYTSRSDINILQDGSGFSTASIYATTEELTTALIAVGEIIKTLLDNENTPERSLHNIAIITTPPNKKI